MCVCRNYLINRPMPKKFSIEMLTGFILFHRVLNLFSLRHWLLHRAFRVDTTSIPIFRESWSPSFRLLYIRFPFTIFKDAFGNGFLGLMD